MSSTGEDEAGRALRVLLEADVEPDRRVERRHLVEQDVGELVLEGVGVLGRGEVAALAAPAGDRAGHAPDHLLDGALALVRARAAAEVLLGDDVGGVLRPGRRELDAALLERRVLGVADQGIADLPLDAIDRMPRLAPPQESPQAVQKNPTENGLIVERPLHGVSWPHDHLNLRSLPPDRHGLLPVPTSTIPSVFEARTVPSKTVMTVRSACTRRTNSVPSIAALTNGVHISMEDLPAR